MASSRILEVVLTGKDDGALALMGKLRDSTEQTEDRTKRMGERFQVAGGLMLGAAATIGAGMYAAGKSAAALEQAVGGTEAVFEGSSSTIDAWAKGAATSAGLSEEAARRLSTRLGGALQGLGYDQAEAAKQAVSLTQLGGDLAATYGGETSEAVEALGSAFRGEFDPLEQFNIFLKQSEVDAKAVAMGLAKNTNDVDKNARAQATLAMVMEQSSAAQGQFGRESNTTSGQMAIAAAQAENAKAALGEGFMPVMSKVAGMAGGVAAKFSEMNAETNGSMSTIASWGVVALGAAGAGSMLIGTGMKMHESFTAATTAMKGMSASTVLGSTAMVAGIAAVLVATEKLKSDSAEFSTNMFKGLDFTDIDKTNDKLGRTQQEILGGIKRWQEYDNVQKLVHIGEGKNLRDASAQFEEYARHQQDVVRSTQNIGHALNLSNKEAGALLTSLKIDPTTVPFEKLVDVLGRLQSGTITAGQAQLELSAAATTAAGTEKTLGEVTEDAGKIRDEANKKWDTARKVLSDYFDEASGQIDKERAVAETADKFSQTLVENNKTLFGAWTVGSQQGRDNQKAFEDAARAALELGLANVQAGGDIGQNSQMVNDQIGKLREQAIRYGLSGQQVDEYLARLRLTPPEVTTAFNAPGLAEAKANAEALNTALGQVQSGLSGIVSKVGSTVAGIAASIGMGSANRLAGFDSGGVVPGPRGSAQLVVAHGGETFIPTHKSGFTATGGGSSITINVAGSVVSERDLFTVVQRAALEAQRVSATPVLPGVSG